MTVQKTTEVLVWDPRIRLFHWILVAAFGAAYITQGEPFEAIQEHLESDWLQAIHVWAGYTIVGLLIFRLIWGFIGPRYARFSDFVRGPRHTIAYAKDVLTLRATRHLGHNPAGGAMIICLLFTLTVTVISGLGLYGADQGLGPLAGWLTNTRDSTAHTLKEVHEFFANFTLLLIGGHLLGVIWESVLHRENLAHAMITGRKRA